MAIGDKKPVVMQSDRAVNGGIATLDSVGNVPFEQLGNAVRPNLIDNGCFVNPVNQRGQMEYTAAGYTIDRWKMSYWSATNPKVVVSSEGVTVSNENASGTPNTISFYQIVEHPERFAGQKVTLSVLLGDVSINSIGVYLRIYINGSAFAGVRITNSNANGVVYKTATLPSEISSMSVYVQHDANNGGSGSVSLNLKAMKLELGDTQTLAHQDASGNWVLNEIPNYGEELAKCRRSTADNADTYANQPVVHGYVTNPNLLHNWYFANPVNQRGQTEYSGSAYGIDRWRMGSANLKVEGDGISLAWTGASGSTNGYIQQFMEQDYSGREVTVSVLLDSGLYSMTETLKAGSTDRYTLDIDGGNLQLNYGVYSTLNSVILRNYTTTPVKVIAMKAELGSTQTLAHKEGNTWVLNEIPDFGEELAKCQRYLFKARSATRAYYVTPNGLRAFVFTPVSLRATPTLIGTCTVTTTGGVAVEGFTVNSLNQRDGGISVVFSKATHGLSDAAVSFGDDAYFSAELP